MESLSSQLDRLDALEKEATRLAGDPVMTFATRQHLRQQLMESWPALSSQVHALIEERDALRQQVADMELLRAARATALFGGVRVVKSPLVERGTVMVNDQDCDAALSRSKEEPRA